MEATSPNSIPSSCTACSPCGQPSGPTRPTVREPLRPLFLQASTHRPLQQCQPAQHPDPHLPHSLAPHPLSSLLPTQLPLSLFTEVVAVVEPGVDQPAQGGPKPPQSSLTLLLQDPPKSVSTHPLPPSLQPHQLAQPQRAAQQQPQGPAWPQKRPRAGPHGPEGL